MEEVDIPEAGKAYIVHYDEQFPKKGRCQKFRLTLLDAKTNKPIAEELFDDKDSPIIKEFLISNLDINEPIYIVTDFGTSYPKILKEIFGNKLFHQYCLFHLNKLIAKDFYSFVHELELERRRKKENHEMHSLEKSKNNLDELLKEKKFFEEEIQTRLSMIKVFSTK
jgi:hypothetical protein